MIAACGHSTASFLAKGEEYLQKRKYHDALMQFRSAAESDADSGKAHWGLARSYEKLGQFNETLEELRKSVELDGSNLEAKARLGNYFLLVQPPMIAETEKIRDEILEADPAFIEGHILGASILAAQGKPDADIVAAVNKAIAMDPQRIESYISLQRLYMTRDDAAKAERAIQNGISANPAAVAGYTEYGRFLMYTKRDAEAELQFKKGIEVDQLGIESRESIAEFYVTAGQMDKAEQTYHDLVQIQENSPESRLVLAGFYNNAGRKDEAINTLTAIVGESPEYVLARYRLAEIYLDRRETVKVGEHLDALLKINDDDTEALTLRARLNIQQHRFERAVEDLAAVLKVRPSSRDPLFYMAQARISLGEIGQANAIIADLERYHPAYLRSGLLKIQSAFASGDSNAAVRLANELIAKAERTTPDADTTSSVISDVRIRALSSRGLAYLELRKLAEAKADLEEIVRLSPGSSSALVNLAKVSIAEGNDQAAFDLYEKALNADTQSFDAVSGVVNTLVRMDRFEIAHSRVNGLFDTHAGKADVLAALHYLKASIFTAEKNLAEAEPELIASIGLDPDYLPAYSAYASLLVEQQRTDEAIAQYQKVIEKRPAAQIFTLLGILEDARGNTKAAEIAYRKALEITPETPIAANNLAWLIADNQGNLDEALQLATIAVGKNQSVAGFYDTLGWVYLKKGLPSPAVEQLKKAVALDDSNSQKTGSGPNPGYRVRLGMALVKAGDKLSARREVEMSLRNKDVLTQREIQDAKTVLASL